MAFRPKNTPISNVNRRIIPIFDGDRLRIQGNDIPCGNSDFHAVPLSMSYSNSTTYNGTNTHSEPPALPPRVDANRNRYSAYNTMCSPYSRFSPSMFGYGGYRTPYNRYVPGMSHDSYNSFIQLAEESTRPAFESIESVVDIVSSISMMLESTYHAVYSSYHAILGVVEQFSRLRDHLAEVLSFLAVLRGLKYLCLKILYLLRLKKDNPSVEAAWNTAKSVSGNPDFSQFHNDPKSPWPFFIFVGLVIGAPWLMFRLLARSVAKKPFDLNTWKSEKGMMLKCTANYTFSTNRRGELPFTAGESLFIAPKNFQVNSPKGWFLACNKNYKVGLVPANYFKTRPTTGITKLVIKKNQNPTKSSEVSNAVTIKLDVVPAKIEELSKDVPVNPFVEEFESMSEAGLFPSTLEESNVENGQ